MIRRVEGNGSLDELFKLGEALVSKFTTQSVARDPTLRVRFPQRKSGVLIPVSLRGEVERGEND